MNNKPLTEEEIRAKLTPEAYSILREGGTEIPGTGALLHEKRDGTYKCMVCENPLFSSNTKFESGTGWPSFDEAIPGSIDYIEDTSHGMHRTEIVCHVCKSHLGHVFSDGPTHTGKRYCLNSVCLDFDTKNTKE